MKIKLIINTTDNEYDITMDEAYELYKELDKLFGETYSESTPSYPINPITYPSFYDKDYVRKYNPSFPCFDPICNETTFTNLSNFNKKPS